MGAGLSKLSVELVLLDDVTLMVDIDPVNLV